MPQETQQKTFKFVKSSKGQINFRAPLSAPPPARTRQTRLSRLSGTQSNYLWWLAISYLSCIPTPLRSRTIMTDCRALPRSFTHRRHSLHCVQRAEHLNVLCQIVLDSILNYIFIDFFIYKM